MDRTFIEALESGSLERLQAIPMSDLHSHGGRGGSLSYIEQWAGVKIAPPTESFDSLDAMECWFHSHVKPYCPGLPGYLKQFEAAFAQATADNLQVLALSFSIETVASLGGLATFTAIMNGLHSRFAPNTIFCPDLALGYPADKNAYPGLLDGILCCGWFRGIDICNYAGVYTLSELKTLCRRARSRGMLLKAHAGEFGGADEVLRYAGELELDEIQHGIAAAESPSAMRWLADNGIRLNVCPTSNLLLGRVGSYGTHPIRRLFDSGVPLTVNTDDLLIFNSTVSQEYLRLYSAGLLDAEELDVIRMTGLRHQYRR